MPNIRSHNWDRREGRCALHPACHSLPCMECISAHDSAVTVELTNEDDRALASPLEMEKLDLFVAFPETDRPWLAERAT